MIMFNPVVHSDNFIEKTVSSSEILKEFCIENKVFEKIKTEGLIRI